VFLRCFSGQKPGRVDRWAECTGAHCSGWAAGERGARPASTAASRRRARGPIRRFHFKQRKTGQAARDKSYKSRPDHCRQGEEKTTCLTRARHLKLGGRVLRVATASPAPAAWFPCWCGSREDLLTIMIHTNTVSSSVCSTQSSLYPGKQSQTQSASLSPRRSPGRALKKVPRVQAPKTQSWNNYRMSSASGCRPNLNLGYIG